MSVFWFCFVGNMWTSLMAIGLVASFFTPLFGFGGQTYQYLLDFQLTYVPHALFGISMLGVLWIYMLDGFFGPDENVAPPKSCWMGSTVLMCLGFLAVLSSSLLFLRTLPFLPMFVLIMCGPLGLVLAGRQLKYPKLSYKNESIDTSEARHLSLHLEQALIVNVWKSEALNLDFYSAGFWSLGISSLICLGLWILVVYELPRYSLVDPSFVDPRELAPVACLPDSRYMMDADRLAMLADREYVTYTHKYEVNVNFANWECSYLHVRTIIWLSPLIASAIYGFLGLTFYFRALLQTGFTKEVRERELIQSLKNQEKLNQLLNSETHVDTPLFQRLLGNSGTPEANDDSLKLSPYLMFAKLMIKTLLCVAIFFVMVSYFSASVIGAGGELTSFVMFVSSILLLFFSIFMFMSMRKVMTHIAQGLFHNPMIHRMTESLRKSNFIRALVVIFGFPFFGILILLSVVNQFIRSRRGGVGPSRPVSYRRREARLESLSDSSQESEAEPPPAKSWLTPRVSRMVQAMHQWDWILIVIWIHRIALIIFCLNVIVGIGISICLAAFNFYLTGIEFWKVILFFFGVGLIMFALPPVPGAPIYMLGGSCLVSNRPPSWSFAQAAGFSVVLCVCLKMTAIFMQQVLIGQTFKKNMGIQLMVGIHTPAMRGMKILLHGPAFEPGKMALLVGGPDWPTSVLTGILGLPAWPMLRDSIPIAPFCALCSLAGSFLTMGPTDKVFAGFASLCILCAVMMGSFLSVAAAYYLQRVIDANYEEVSLPKVEFLHLDWASYRAEELGKVRDQLVRNLRVPAILRLLGCISVVAAVATSYIFNNGLHFCFQTFTITSDIQKMDQYFIRPTGYLGLMTFGVTLLGYYAMDYYFGSSAAALVSRRRIELEKDKNRWERARVRECQEAEGRLKREKQMTNLFRGRLRNWSKKAHNTTHNKELWAVNMLVPSQQGQPELSADDRIQILNDKLEKISRKLEVLTGFK